MATLAERAAGVIQVDHLDIEVNLDESYGSYIYDDKLKKHYLDCFSYIASNPLGHNHKSLLTEGSKLKLLTAAINNPTNSDVLTPQFVSFLETFKRVAMPPEFQKAFFIAGGSAAVENALKTAFDWKIKTNRNNDIHVNPNDLEIIHFTNAFHGRGGYTLSLTNTSDPRKFRDFPKFKWPRFKADDIGIAQISKYIDTNKNKIAAIIIEPIQGEGGDVHFADYFHMQLRRCADDAEALLIYDEVQTGVGLTGKFWAYQHTPIVPDVIVFGKKMQVCGIMVGEKVLKLKDNVFEEQSRINSTWGGNLVDFVRSQIILETIENDDLVKNADTTGAYFLTKLHEQFTGSPLVTNIRGQGLMIAFDLPDTDSRNRLLKALFKEGVIALGCGTKTVRVRPSLIFNQKNVNLFLGLLNEAVRYLSREDKTK